MVFLSSVGAERHGVGHIDGLALPEGRRRGSETDRRVDQSAPASSPRSRSTSTPPVPPCATCGAATSSRTCCSIRPRSRRGSSPPTPMPTCPGRGSTRVTSATSGPPALRRLERAGGAGRARPGGPVVHPRRGDPHRRARSRGPCRAGHRRRRSGRAAAGRDGARGRGGDRRDGGGVTAASCPSSRATCSRRRRRRWPAGRMCTCGRCSPGSDVVPGSDQPGGRVGGQEAVLRAGR